MDTLQIKRVTANWSKYREEIPADGEPVLIALTDSSFAYDTSPSSTTGPGDQSTELPTESKRTIGGDTTPCFVIGDGVTTLENLLWNPRRLFVSMGSIDDRFDNRLKRIELRASGTEAKQSSVEATVDKYIMPLLKFDEDVDKFTCRRIKAGYDDPPTSGVSTGDIYIKLEKN